MSNEIKELQNITINLFYQDEIIHELKNKLNKLISYFKSIFDLSKEALIYNDGYFSKIETEAKFEKLKGREMEEKTNDELMNIYNIITSY